MKRTKQAYFRPNPTELETKQSSGLTYVIGQDVPFQCRTRDDQKMQKQFLDEQVDQKKQIKHMQKTMHQDFDSQLLRNNHHRGQLQLEKSNRLNMMERAHDDYNLQAANERKMREKQDRERQLEGERRELELLEQRRVKRWVPGQSGQQLTD